MSVNRTSGKIFFMGMIVLSQLSQDLRAQEQGLEILTPKTCLACNWKLTDESSEAGAESPCEDLYSAVCLSPGHSNRFANRASFMSRQLRARVQRVQNRALRALGYQSFADMFSQALNKTGIANNGPASLTRANIAYLTNSTEYGSLASSGGDLNAFLVEPTNCVTKKSALDSAFNSLAYNYNPTSVELAKMNELHVQYSQLEDAVRLRKSELFTADPKSLIKRLGRLCNSSEGLFNPLYKMKNESEKALKAYCLNPEPFKKEVSLLWRLRNQDGATQRHRTFVEKYSHLLDVNIHQTSQSYNPPISLFPPEQAAVLAPKTPEQIETERIKGEFSALKSKVEIKRNNYGLCTDVTIINSDAAIAEMRHFMEAFSKSQPTVEGLINEFYEESKFAPIFKMFGRVRDEIADLVPRFVKDQSKTEKILAGYSNIDLIWLRAPGDDAYIVDKKTGFRTLDTERLNLEGNILAMAFDDSSFFTSINAFYQPKMVIGDQLRREKIVMMPFFVAFFETMPFSFLEVLSHEAAHRIGPQVAKLNGFNLDEEYREVLSCFQSSDLISMDIKQSDETIADSIAAEVVASVASELPLEDQTRAVMSSVTAYCLFSGDKHRSLSPEFEGGHPEPSLRVSGVFGGNPSIRKILGCGLESKNFKSCGLRR